LSRLKRMGNERYAMRCIEQGSVIRGIAILERPLKPPEVPGVLVDIVERPDVLAPPERGMRSEEYDEQDAIEQGSKNHQCVSLYHRYTVAYSSSSGERVLNGSKSTQEVQKGPTKWYHPV